MATALITGDEDIAEDWIVNHLAVLVPKHNIDRIITFEDFDDSTYRDYAVKHDIRLSIYSFWFYTVQSGEYDKAQIFIHFDGPDCDGTVASELDRLYGPMEVIRIKHRPE